MAANADVIVKCPWMGGSEVTVSTAMNAYNYPPNLTAENEPFLMSVVYELLANRVAEIEESEEKETEEETSETEEKNQIEAEEPLKLAILDKKAQLEADPKKASRNEVETQEQLKNEAVNTARSKPPAPRTEKPVKPESRVPVEAEPETDARRAEPEQPGRSEAETPAAARVTPEAPAPRTADDKAELAPDGLSHTLVKETEPSVITPEAEDIVETAAKPPQLDYEEAAGVSAGEDLISGETEAHAEEDEPVQDYEIGINDLHDFIIEDEPTELIENEILNLRVFENGLETEAETPTPTVTRPDEEPLILEQTAAPDAEQLTVDELDVEKIEGSLREVLERVTDADPETTGAVSEILDKIIEMPSELEDIGYEDVSAQEQTEEKLQERFAELLTILNIDYNDELLEALALLAIRTCRYDKEEQVEDKRTDDTPQEYGTREIKIINQLLSCLGAIPRTLADVYIIGRSAIQLSFDLAA